MKFLRKIPQNFLSNKAKYTTYLEALKQEEDKKNENFLKNIANFY